MKPFQLVFRYGVLIRNIVTHGEKLNDKKFFVLDGFSLYEFFFFFQKNFHKETFNFQLHRNIENERADENRTKDYIFSDNLSRNKPR